MAITLQEMGTDGIDGTDTGLPRPPSQRFSPWFSEPQEFALLCTGEPLSHWKTLAPPPTVQRRLHRGSSGLFLLISTSRLLSTQLSTEQRRFHAKIISLHSHSRRAVESSLNPEVIYGSPSCSQLSSGLGSINWSSTMQSACPHSTIFKCRRHSAADVGARPPPACQHCGSQNNNYSPTNSFVRLEHLARRRSGPAVTQSLNQLGTEQPVVLGGKRWWWWGVEGGPGPARVARLQLLLVPE